MLSNRFFYIDGTKGITFRETYKKHSILSKITGQLLYRFVFKLWHLYETINATMTEDRYCVIIVGLGRGLLPNILEIQVTQMYRYCKM